MKESKSLTKLKEIDFIVKEFDNGTTLGYFDEDFKDNFKPIAFFSNITFPLPKGLVNLFENSVELLKIAEEYRDKLKSENKDGLSLTKVNDIIKNISM